MMKSRIIQYLMILALFSLSVACCSKQGSASSPPEGAGEVITLKIGKMTCGSCAHSAKIALQKVNHVVKAQVSFETKTGKVYVEKGKSVNVDDLIKALKKIGYTAKLIGQRRLL